MLPMLTFTALVLVAASLGWVVLMAGRSPQPTPVPVRAVRHHGTRRRR